MARARTDALRLERIERRMERAVVILGGSDANQPGDLDRARALGRCLASLGLPLRTRDRSGAVAQLVASARELAPTLRVESVDTEGHSAHPTDLRYKARTHELGTRLAMEQAHAYVVLPGGLTSLWELMQIWTLVRTGKIAAQPIVLVGSRDYWEPILRPLIQPALACGAIKPDFLDSLTFADTAEEAVGVLRALPADRGRAAPTMPAFLAEVRHDLAHLPDVMRGFDHSVVVLGAAGVKPGSEAYERCRRFGRELEAPIRTGGGPGVMEAAPRGARERDPRAVTEAINIKLPKEQLLNSFIDPAHAAEGRTLEVRERLVLEKASCYVFFAGGTGTWVELFQLWELMRTGELAVRPILVDAFYRDSVGAFLSLAIARGYIDAQAASLITFCQDEQEMATRARAAYAAARPKQRPQ